MEFLVAYDVATTTPEGRTRLRQVARICEAYGQRVQQSVFECILDAVQLELLLHQLRTTINLEEDSLRIYRLREPRAKYLRVIGKHPLRDLHDSLIL